MACIINLEQVSVCLSCNKKHYKVLLAYKIFHIDWFVNCQQKYLATFTSGPKPGTVSKSIDFRSNVKSTAFVAVFISLLIKKNKLIWGMLKFVWSLSTPRKTTHRLVIFPLLSTHQRDTPFKSFSENAWKSYIPNTLIKSQKFNLEVEFWYLSEDTIIRPSN